MWKSLLGGVTTILTEPDETPKDDDTFFNPPKLPPSPRAALFARKNPSDYGEADVASGITKNAIATPTNSTPKRQDSAARKLQELGQAHRGSCSSLVDKAKCGGMATLLIFEHSQVTRRQTLEAVIPMISKGIFSGLPENHIVKAICVELHGPRCTDLTLDGDSPSRVVDNADGSVRFVNTIGRTCGTPEDLKDWILLAKNRLEARVEAGDNFLPRHMVCRIIIVPPKDAPSCVRQGTLTILDCPATARRDITLRECLRAHASDSNEKPPYENSTLTRCMRECLEREDATCQIIESEKSNESLYELPTSDANGDTSEEPPNKVPLPPKRWNHSTLCDWLVSRHLIQDRDAVRKDLNGRSIMNMSKAELQEVLYSTEINDKKADLLYRCLRAETDRVARLELKERMATYKSRRR